MEKRFLQLNDITSYQSAFAFGNEVWQIVIGWDYFAKDTIGKQFVNATPSLVRSNLQIMQTGFGRTYRSRYCMCRDCFAIARNDGLV